MLTDLEIMDIHIRALFTHNAESRLLFVNEPDDVFTPAPRLYIGRTRTGNLWRFRADIPEELCRKLDALCADEPSMNAEFNEPPRHLETFVSLLETHAPVQEISSGPAYQFTEYNSPSRPVITVTENNVEILQEGFEKLVSELPAWQPFVALSENSQAVSVCRSVRITPDAHEAGVETLPDFRGKGYAADVVTGWASKVKSMGAVPLYSTSWENNASQAVARKLRLKCYGTDFHIT